MNIKKDKKKTKSQWKKLAWQQYSLYIRLTRDHTPNDNYLRECYTCGVVKNYKEMQAGHGIAGRGNAVLFMEDLTRIQCVKCNIFKGGELAVFTRELIKEHGIDKYDLLVLKAKLIIQMKAQDYEEEYWYYKKLNEK